MNEIGQFSEMIIMTKALWEEWNSTVVENVAPGAALQRSKGDEGGQLPPEVKIFTSQY